MAEVRVRYTNPAAGAEQGWSQIYKSMEDFEEYISINKLDVEKYTVEVIG